MCKTLDEALAEGQLTTAEHESRVSAAMHAKTVAELRHLVADLQSVNPPPTQHVVASPSTTAFRIVVPSVATILVLILLIALAGRLVGSGDDDAVAEPDAPAEQNKFLSLPGLREVVAAVAAELGTTQVDDLTVYDDYAVVFIPDPQAPRMRLSYYYNGEFRAPSQAGTRSYEDTIDIATVDLARVAGALAGAAESLNLTRIDTLYVIFRNLDGEPEVLIHANNELGESGHTSLTPEGEFTGTYPFDPGA